MFTTALFTIAKACNKPKQRLNKPKHHWQVTNGTLFCPKEGMKACTCSSRMDLETVILNQVREGLASHITVCGI